MKIIKKFLVVFFALLLTACSYNVEDNTTTVVTSFYPIYTFAAAITKGTPIKPINMAKPQTGCLHEYQLTTGDMRTISSANIFIINGAGMEDGFIEKALSQNPQIHVVDSSIGTNKLENPHAEHENHEEHTGHQDHNHSEGNSHIWMSVDNAIIQTKNIEASLSRIFPQYAEAFGENSKAFCEKLESLKSEKHNLQNVKALSFHEAFDFLSHDFGFTITETVEIDNNALPSAKTLAELIDEARADNVSIILCADDGGKVYAQTVAAELNVPIAVLNPITSGEMNAEGYIDAQKQNLETLKAVINIE